MTTDKSKTSGVCKASEVSRPSTLDRRDSAGYAKDRQAAIMVHKEMQ